MFLFIGTLRTETLLNKVPAFFVVGADSGGHLCKKDALLFL